MVADSDCPLAQALIRCPSVTPDDAGALGVLEAALKPLGFTAIACALGATADRKSLCARSARAAPQFLLCRPHRCGAGGRRLAHDPFAAEVKDGMLYGRGAADMKSAIAAFVAAVARYSAERASPAGSISLLITGDEEGPAVNGTVKVLDWLKARGEKLDHCLVGEPSSHASSAI